MLTLKQMRYFDALATTLHFGRAAEAAHVSQPALSAQISGMERHLGVKLVERGRGTTILTSHGERLVPRIRAILAEVNALESEPRGRGVLRRAGPDRHHTDRCALYRSDPGPAASRRPSRHRDRAQGDDHRPSRRRPEGRPPRRDRGGASDRRGQPGRAPAFRGSVPRRRCRGRTRPAGLADRAGGDRCFPAAASGRGALPARPGPEGLFGGGRTPPGQLRRHLHGDAPADGQSRDGADARSRDRARDRGLAQRDADRSFRRSAAVAHHRPGVAARQRTQRRLRAAWPGDRRKCGSRDGRGAARSSLPGGTGRRQNSASP